MKPKAPEKETVSNIKVGKPDTVLTSPSHVKGIRQGNEIGGMQREPGLHDDGKTGTGDARRSTGINPKNRDAIDPKMPNLSPA